MKPKRIAPALVMAACLLGVAHTAAATAPRNGRIAFVTNRDDAQPGWNGFCCHIDTMAADGSGVQPLFPQFVKTFDPAWSPDGSQIAFATDAKTGFPNGSTTAIYIADVDGSHVRRLTAIGEHDALPAWSPDGRRIAFFSDRDGN
jgi:Tol biopolymer transport system component